MLNPASLGDRVRRFVHYALSRQADPNTVSENILRYLSRERTPSEVQNHLRKLVEKREIVTLVHFTPLSNIPQILRFGLIPRQYLDYSSIAVAVKPEFTDTDRADGRRDCTCISVTFPNYQMLYKKRREGVYRFGVIELTIEPMIEHRCHFSDTNAARPTAKIGPGAGYAELMFDQMEVRRELNLPPNYTTDPQAEILNSSVIPPKWVAKAAVETEGDKNWLSQEISNIPGARECPVEVAPDYFKPRKDWQHWKTG